MTPLPLPPDPLTLARRLARACGVECPECDGAGWVEYTPMAGSMHDDSGECVRCGGTGRLPVDERWRPSWLTQRYLIDPIRYVEDR